VSARASATLTLVVGLPDAALAARNGDDVLDLGDQLLVAASAAPGASGRLHVDGGAAYPRQRLDCPIGLVFQLIADGAGRRRQHNREADPVAVDLSS